MGNNVIAGKCCPYICLLGQLLKGGGAGSGYVLFYYFEVFYYLKITQLVAG